MADAISNMPVRRAFTRRRKVCPFSGEGAPKIDHKDPKLLQRYIKRARQLALLPYAVK